MVVETPPLYKDLEILDCPAKALRGFFFRAVFVCILSKTTQRKCDPILYLIDTKKNGVHLCNPFRNSNLFFDLSIPQDLPGHDSRQLGAGCHFIDGRLFAIDD